MQRLWISPLEVPTLLLRVEGAGLEVAELLARVELPSPLGGASELSVHFPGSGPRLLERALQGSRICGPAFGARGDSFEIRTCGSSCLLAGIPGGERRLEEHCVGHPDLA